jgi:hypothetical protein
MKHRLNLSGFSPKFSKDVAASCHRKAELQQAALGRERPVIPRGVSGARQGKTAGGRSPRSDRFGELFPDRRFGGY